MHGVRPRLHGRSAGHGTLAAALALLQGGLRCGPQDRHACVPACPCARSSHSSLDSFSAEGITRLDESLEDLASRPRTSARRLVRVLRLVFIIVHLHQCMAAWHSSWSPPCRKVFRNVHPRFAHVEVADQSRPRGSTVAQPSSPSPCSSLEGRPAARGASDTGTNGSQNGLLSTKGGRCQLSRLPCNSQWPSGAEAWSGLRLQWMRQPKREEGGHESSSSQHAARMKKSFVGCQEGAKKVQKEKCAGESRHGASFSFHFETLAKGLGCWIVPN